MYNSRRDFLKFLGLSTYSLSQLSAISFLSSCDKTESLFPSLKDDLVLIEGLEYKKLISFGDSINTQNVFGFNNDFITYKKLASDELLMWVNHEYVNPFFVSGFERTKENIDKERALVGGSIIKIKKINNEWTFVSNDPLNRAVRADTAMIFANGIEIEGSNSVIGTCSNCAGGYTPWNTFLTCEENTDQNYGERDSLTKTVSDTKYGWNAIYPHPPEHYGWIVEVEPETGKAKKHTNLGRFAHECATTIVSKSNQVVVYSADDKADEHIYKFISKTNSNFEKGILYVADTKNGKWLPLDLELSPILKKHFKSHTDLMINTREASKILGATPLNRPEDIEVHPLTGDVYITLTKNPKRKDYFGSILKISEKESNHSSTTFSAEIFLLGGEENSFSCPDNLAFDKNGNLWMCTDMSGPTIGKGPYTSFGNNGLFVIPTMGPRAGKVIQVASAPVDAELTGLCFSPDQKELFLSVQHPGELSTDLKNPTSHWPNGGESTPRPSVVVISGEFLENLTK